MKNAWMALLLIAGSAACAGARRRADMPSDLRDAPAALPHAAMPAPITATAARFVRRSAPRSHARADFATELAQWHESMYRAIEADGGFGRLPENLRLRLGLRLSEVEALYQRDDHGRLRPRMSRFATRSRQEILEWIEPVQRFYRNAIERNPSVPATIRRDPDRLYQELQRSADAR